MDLPKLTVAAPAKVNLHMNQTPARCRYSSLAMMTILMTTTTLMTKMTTKTMIMKMKTNWMMMTRKTTIMRTKTNWMMTTKKKTGTTI
jgi:hypothetical protein